MKKILEKRNALGKLGLAAIAASCLYSGTVSADTIFTVNGVDVDSSVVDLYFQRRGVQPEMLSSEQRQALMSELRQIYTLATLDVAKQKAQQPEIAAQLELQRHSMLAQLVAADFFQNNPVSDQQVQNEYQTQLSSFPGYDYKARHILLGSEQEANEVIAALDAGGDFETLAKEKSIGPTGPNGGDLGWFSPGQMVGEFYTATSEIEDGSYTKQPVQTQFGWHVIFRDDSRASTPPTLEASADAIRQKLQNDMFQEYLNSLTSQAN